MGQKLKVTVAMTKIPAKTNHQYGVKYAAANSTTAPTIRIP